MGKLVVSLDGVVIKEVQITKDKTTLGRRPYNDIVIDNLAVSGEHAVLQMVGADVFIEDLNSTNGTYINGKAVKKQLLAHNDTVEVGKYKIRFLAGHQPFAASRPMTMPAPLQPVAPIQTSSPSRSGIAVSAPLGGGVAPAAANLGALLPDAGYKTATLVPHLVPARCDAQGLLLIGDPPTGFGSAVLPGNDFHVFDYALFWANIRADAARRLAAFEKHRR